MIALLVLALLVYAVYNPTAAGNAVATGFYVIHDIVVFSYHAIVGAIA